MSACCNTVKQPGHRRHQGESVSVLWVVIAKVHFTNYIWTGLQQAHMMLIAVPDPLGQAASLLGYPDPTAKQRQFFSIFNCVC